MKDKLGRENCRHGHARNKKSTPTYSTWKSIKARCLDAKQSSYKYYGAKGIAICDRWMEFDNFLADMGERPSLNHSIDRIDSTGHYEPGNCRWATAKEQSRNTSRNRMITHNGITLCMAEWAENLGVSFTLVRARLNRGWDHSRALTEPVK